LHEGWLVGMESEDVATIWANLDEPGSEEYEAENVELQLLGHRKEAEEERCWYLKV
jgi:hypothetical protein